MSERGEAFIAGWIFGSAVFAAILSVAPSLHKQAYDAVLDCQKSLPRTQECKVIAVPVMEGRK